MGMKSAQDVLDHDVDFELLNAQVCVLEQHTGGRGELGALAGWLRTVHVTRVLPETNWRALVRRKAGLVPLSRAGGSLGEVAEGLLCFLDGLQDALEAASPSQAQ